MSNASELDLHCKQCATEWVVPAVTGVPLMTWIGHLESQKCPSCQVNYHLSSQHAPREAA